MRRLAPDVQCERSDVVDVGEVARVEQVVTLDRELQRPIGARDRGTGVEHGICRRAIERLIGRFEIALGNPVHVYGQSQIPGRGDRTLITDETARGPLRRIDRPLSLQGDRVGRIAVHGDRAIGFRITRVEVPSGQHQGPALAGTQREFGFDASVARLADVPRDRHEQRNRIVDVDLDVLVIVMECRDVELPEVPRQPGLDPEFPGQHPLLVELSHGPAER